MQLSSRYINGIKILELSGSFDNYTAEPVKDWLNSAASQPPAKIVVNLKRVNFLDSTALSILVHALKRSREFQGDLCLCEVQQPVRMIFELTRLDKFFEIAISEDEAVQTFLV